ncbi:MAG: glycosyltransferase [Planctomycetota bacterium]
MPDKSLTAGIVIPCFNEETRLPTARISAWAAAHPSVHFRFVDDGSTDGTGPLIDSLAATIGGDRASAVHLARNGGKGEAVRAGLLSLVSSGQFDAIGYWDADLATPLDEIPQFVAYLASNPVCQVVLGSRVRLLGRRVGRRLSRHLLGRVFATLASIALDMQVYDTQCGAKLLRVTPQLTALMSTPFRSRWVFDVEILERLVGKWAEAGEPYGGPADQRIVELPVTEWEDVRGSKLRWRHYLGVLRALWGVFKRRRKSAASK